MTSSDDVSSFIRDEDYSLAFDLIKKNPMIPITFADAVAMLDNIDRLVQTDGTTNVDFDAQAKLYADATALLYRRLQRQKVLKGFGCISKDNYPEKTAGENCTTLFRI